MSLEISGFPGGARVGVVGFAPMSAYSGIAVRARAVVEDVLSLGVTPTLIAVGRTQGGRALVVGDAELAVDAVEVGSKPAMVARLAARLHALRGRLDLLVIESAMFAPSVLLSGLRCPLVWDINELEVLHYSRMAPSAGTRARWAAWRALEECAARQSSVVVAISEEEARWCDRLLPSTRGRVRVVPHRVPSAPILRPDPPCDGSLGPTWHPESGLRLVFVGNMSAKHNRIAARWILDRLAGDLELPARILLIGPGSESLSGAERSEVVVVECLGPVDDLSSVVRPSDIALAPLGAGAGVKTKVLDYLALGCRVVATPVALEGIDDAPGVTLASLESFPAAISALWGAGETAQSQQQRSRDQAAWLANRASATRTRAGWESVFAGLGLATS